MPHSRMRTYELLSPLWPSRRYRAAYSKREFSTDRNHLMVIVESDLSLSTIVKTMVESERSLNANHFYCENVMSRKVAAERDREDTSSLPFRTCRIGSGRTIYHVFPRRLQTETSATDTRVLIAQLLGIKIVNAKYPRFSFRRRYT